MRVERGYSFEDESGRWRRCYVTVDQDDFPGECPEEPIPRMKFLNDKAKRMSTAIITAEGYMTLKVCKKILEDSEA